MGSRKPVAKKQKTPRKGTRPGTAISPQLQEELTAWDASFTDLDGVDYIEFSSIDEFKAYIEALGESLEIDPEGIH